MYTFWIVDYWFLKICTPELFPNKADNCKNYYLDLDHIMIIMISTLDIEEEDPVLCPAALLSLQSSRL